MNNKVIVFKNLDGSCGIIHPAPEMFDENSMTRLNIGIEFTSDDDILNWIANKDTPAGLSWRICDIECLPTCKSFRGAWTDDGDTITVDIDIEKAKSIKIDEFRKLRNPILKELDNKYFAALENSEDSSEIVFLKKQLRDITKIDLPDDIEALKEFMPDILNNH